MAHLQRRHLPRILAGFGAVGLVLAMSAAVASPAYAKGTTKYKFKSTYTTSSLGTGGSFSAPFSATKKGASMSATLSGTATQGPGKKTKTKVKDSDVPLGTDGVAGGFSVPVDGPWQTSQLTGTIILPTGGGAVGDISIDVDCTCNWSGLSWTWTTTITYVATS